MPDVPTEHPPHTHGAERRRFQRVDVRINMAGQLSSSRVRLVNVSTGGCLVHASHMLEPGEPHVLKFRRDPGGEPLALHTRVVYAAPMAGDPDIVCVAGLEFVEDSAAAREASEVLVALAADSATQAGRS